MALIPMLSTYIHAVLLEVFPDLPKDYTLDLAISKRPEFGDYQLNDAMKLAKILKKSPRDIAANIVDAIHLNVKLKKIVDLVEVKGPGFINIFLKNSWIQTVLNQAVDNHFKPQDSISDSPMIVDFSSPNIAKQMHVGHLRSTIIGDSLSRVFEYFGVDVKRLNHIGDWGTSFGMLIAYLKSENIPDQELKEASLDELESWYKLSRERFTNDPAFKKASQLEVVNLQAREENALKLWRIICEISEKAYKEIYDLLDIDIEDRGESFYNPFLAGIVDKLESKGLLEDSDGAKCVFLDGFKNREGEPLPLIVQKSDGGYNYATTDLAAIEYRANEDRAKRVLYVTDSGQATHFAMVFQAASKADLYDPSSVRLDHVPFGLVLRDDGKKFRTREGETTRLIDLLNEAVSRALKVVEERSSHLSEDQKNKLAHVLGLGSIKYADLSNNRVQNYVFSFDKMLQFEGNTLPYLMYSFVRTQGILRQKSIDTIAIEIVEASERALALHLIRFEDVLLEITNDLLLNRLAEYLYELSQLFNAFFRDCRVIGSDKESERLSLVTAAADVFKRSLNLLGIETIDYM